MDKGIELGDIGDVLIDSTVGHSLSILDVIFFTKQFKF